MSPLQHTHERPRQTLGIELKPVIIGAVAHLKYVDHPLALARRMPHAKYRKVDVLPSKSHLPWKAN
jgi:hypothetical protein